jgi:hypothetical protein
MEVEYEPEELRSIVETLFYKPSNRVFVGDMCDKTGTLQLADSFVQKYLSNTYGPCKVVNTIGP